MTVRMLIRDLLRMCELDQEIYCVLDLGGDDSSRIPCVGVTPVKTYNKIEIAVIETLPERKEGLWDDDRP